MEERRRSKRYCNITLLACGSGVKEEEGEAVGRQKLLPPFPSPPLTLAAKAMYCGETEILKITWVLTNPKLNRMKIITEILQV